MTLEKLEFVQYKDIVLITGPIHSTSWEKLYKTGFGNNISDFDLC